MRSNADIIPSIGKAAAVAVCACVVILPVFGGGATPFGSMIARLSAIGMFLFCLLGRRPASGPSSIRRPLGALVLLAVFGLLQGVPWPRGLTQAVSPQHVVLADEAARALEKEPPTGVSFSLYPSASARVALDLLAFAALAGAAVRVGRHRSARLWIAVAIVSSAALQVILGLRAWLSGSVPRLRGFYANPDHLCILLEIAVCIALGAVFWTLSTRRWKDQGTHRAVGVLIAGTLVLLLLSAIAFTGSRAGLLATTVGLGVLSLAASSQRRWVPIALAGAVGLGSVGFLAWIGIGRSFGRLTSTSWFEVASGVRSTVWLESLELVGRFPVVGSGLGTFESAFPLVQPESLAGIRWVKAHNGFLELMVTGGVIGVLIAAWGVVSLLRILTRKLRGSVRTDDRLSLAVAMGSLAAVATHESFDFGLSLWANAFVLVVVVAAALGARVEPRRV